MAKYYVESIGLTITLDTTVDLTLAPTTEIHWKNPNGDTGVWVAGVVDGTKVQYVTVAGDIPAAQVGTWEFLAYVETAAGFIGPGEPVSVTFNAKWV